MFVYLVKLEISRYTNFNSVLFAMGAQNFILPDMWPSGSLYLNPDE